eukprot:8955212-Pyramimonas_sp.AAC.1
MAASLEVPPWLPICWQADMKLNAPSMNAAWQYTPPSHRSEMALRSGSSSACTYSSSARICDVAVHPPAFNPKPT